MASYADRHNTTSFNALAPRPASRNARRLMVEHMGVEHRGFDIAMVQQLLDGSNVRATFEQLCGEGMADSSSIDEISQGIC